MTRQTKQLGKFTTLASMAIALCVSTSLVYSKIPIVSLYGCETLKTDDISTGRKYGSTFDVTDTINNDRTSESASSSPGIAWLLSFPNSGTTYTLKLVQQYTNTTTATNYGNEHTRSGTSSAVVEGNSSTMLESRGPFWRYPNWQKPSQYALTKTHCGGNAIVSNPDEYVETKRSFDVACRTGNKIVNGTKMAVTYGSDVPQRAVHLIRNPLDNVVARFHMELKNWKDRPEKVHRLKYINDTKLGFQTWCRAHDERGRKDEKKSKWFDSELWELAKDVPCHAEFIRYTWWHNNAVELLKMYGDSNQNNNSRVSPSHQLPTLVLYYEDYETHFGQTVSGLLNFLHLQPSSPNAIPLHFIAGKHYEDYYEPETIPKIWRLIKLLTSSTRETWNLLERYT